jgi:hypothetical protein
MTDTGLALLAAVLDHPADSSAVCVAALMSAAVMMFTRPGPGFSGDPVG